MRTELVRIDPSTPDPETIERAAAVIQAGGLVAFPTETVYGLGADATNPAAVERVFVAKGRDRDDPLIVHIADLEDLDTVATGVPPLAARLADRFWPGPLTIIATRHPRLAAGVSGGRSTVAVRVPGHPVALALIRAAGVPIAAPSANRFMHTSPATAGHVLDDLEGRIELVLDGGPVAVGVESTVILVEGDLVRVLRPGGVTGAELAAALRDFGERATLAGQGASTGTSASPGMLERHYAPSVPLVFITGTGDLAAEAVRRIAAAHDAGVRPGLLATDQVDALVAGAEFRARLGPAGDSETHARRLYGAIRQLERSGAGLIVAVYGPEGGLGEAIRDRLRRAAVEVAD